jgi:hypothetical protein
VERACALKREIKMENVHMKLELTSILVSSEEESV